MRPVLRGKISSTGLRVGAVAALALATVASLAAMKSAPVAKAGGGGCSPTVSKQFFGKTIEPYTGKNTAVYRYTLTNCSGMSVKILTYGGDTQEINVPGRHGAEPDVVLGFKTLQDYVNFVSPPVTANGGPYFGEIVGRYANRIAKGTFKLNGQTYTLPINNGVNALHGGLVGFGNHIWAAKPVTGPGSAGVQLTLVSPNGDASGAAGSPGCPSGCTGYPAQLTVNVTYTLNNQDQLAIHYNATNDSKTLSTVLNLTNHSYFNLAGEGFAAGSAYGQYVQMNARQLLADRRHPDPAAAAPRGPGRGHAVRLPLAAHHRLADRRRQRAGQRPGQVRVGHRRQEPAAHRPGLRPQLDPEPADRRRPPVRMALTWPPARSIPRAAVR